MTEDTSQAPGKQGESADAFIVEQMRAGADEETIVAGLVERGADPAQARRRVEVVYPQVMQAAQAELFEPRLLVPAVLAGLAAAVAGGIAWGLIAVTTNYEIGFAALGIGILAGYAVVLATRGRKGLPLQVAAVVSSLLGVALGKYFTYVWELKDAVRAEFGDEAADSIGFLDSEVIDLFVEDADRVFGGYDLLWAAFAVYAAWRIPRALGSGSGAARSPAVDPTRIASLTVMAEKVQKSEQEWRAELTPEQYRVLREHGTERAFTGAYHDTKEPGVYRCAACGAELFRSETKYDSGTGWPSFYEPVSEEAVETERDWALVLPRTEVHCSSCGGHLGHVFGDGPNPTGRRYCINSAALDLERREGDTE